MSRKILIDARMAGAVTHGIARYVTLMADGLRARKLDYEPVFLVREGREFHGFPAVAARSRFLSPSEWREIPALIRQTGASLYHSPSFASLPRCPVPWLVTVHDLNHLTYGDFREKLYYRLLLKRFARGARKVLTVSDFSRGEIEQWLGRSVEVVPNALEPGLLAPVDEQALTKALRARGLERGKYFLCLSNPKPHKNVATLVRAHALLRQQDAEAWPLVLSLREFADQPGIHALGVIDDREARLLLRGAGALVFPSLYEGFGLPPVEATAAGGVPIVVSRIPAHLEGLQDLNSSDALWVEPRDVHGWVSALHKIRRGELSAPENSRRERLIQRYAMARLAENMDRIYTDVLRKL